MPYILQGCRRRVLIALFCFSVAIAASAGMHPAHAQKAMVSSVHALATDAGVEVLREGGNAIDAAVATGFALAVVHPQAGNIGGGGFMLVRMADGKLHFLDYREKAPAAATADMYWDKQGKVIPEMSTVGYKAIGVPGSVAGMVSAEKKWGKLGLQKVMAPAIRLAKDGFPLPWEYAREFQNKRLAQFPESRRVFQRDGNFYQAGDVFKQPDLARTLERIASNPDDFYHGELAQQIAAAMQKGGGIITAQDLANYAVKEREPIHGSYRGYDLYSAPPPSSGGVALVEILNILEKFDLASLGADSAEAMHLTVEAYRRAFMDRADFMGDPDFAKIPVAQLIDKNYASAWRESINPDHASISKDLHRPAGTFNDLDKVARAAAASEAADTTHYSVVDAEGNAVSVTTTLNGSFGSAVTADGLGFLLNNEMDDFAAKVGVPNMYGLIQGPANAVGANKRPLSAMTPTIVTKDDKLFLVLGSPGGPTIITTVANVLMGIVDYGLDVQQAVDAPRFHNQWLPDKTTVERNRFSPDTLKLLKTEGHTIDDKTSYWGDAECIMIDPKTGERLGGHDERTSYGKAAGF
ncbi:MAG TPA: gamma-glutamyltransferase [Terriglobales bacterium]|nr:gamma-glutamyltransferase [Terriglobales bacterium]